MTREEIKKGLISYLDSIKWGIGEYHEVFGSLINMLSLSEKDGWIPVSERLPEKNRAVLTYVDTGASKTYCLAYWKGEGWEEWVGYRMLETEMGYKVLAWQPLPEPYKAESEVKPNE